MTLRAPFPYFGGKSRAASAIWKRFGDLSNYVDPFCGSLAVLLARPHDAGIETVNDADCYLSNFWRALQHDPEGVAKRADWPVNEVDLHARHLWLLGREDFRSHMIDDPDWYDAKVAGWWVWGISAWIGSGWCSGKSLWGGEFADGRLAHERLPNLGSAGMGVHRPSQQLPSLTGSRGINASSRGDLHEYFDALAARLRRVRVCCGDWTRVMGPAVTFGNGLTGVLLDPPYSSSVGRDMNVYAHDDGDVATAVREWAIENGDNPLLRIALCGYDTEHDMPDSWERYAWKAHGGYGTQGNGTGRDNAKRETIWFSPHCLKVDAAVQPALFQLDAQPAAEQDEMWRE